MGIITINSQSHLCTGNVVATEHAIVNADRDTVRETYCHSAFRCMGIDRQSSNHISYICGNRCL